LDSENVNKFKFEINIFTFSVHLVLFTSANVQNYPTGTATYLNLWPNFAHVFITAIHANSLPGVGNGDTIILIS